MNFIKSLKDTFNKLSLLSFGFTLGFAIGIPVSRYFGVSVPLCNYNVDHMILWWASYGIVSFIYNYFFEKNEL